MRTNLICGLLASVIGICGCQGSANTFVDQDPELARETLTTVLEVWKAGQVRSLAKRVPPIRFSDEDQIAGSQLLGFEFEDDTIQIIPFQSVKVELELRTLQGQFINKTVQYQVGVDPVLTVLRSDD